MKKLIFLSLNILISFSFFAQQGKDGAGNITTANTIVNNVSTTLTSNAVIGTTTIAVASSAGLAAGDLLFIMQAQGAKVIDSTCSYNGNTNQVFPFDTSSGKITKYNGAGNNEFAEINSITGNIITLNCALSDSFRGNLATGDTNIITQVVRVKRYTSLTLSGAGSITCNAWNGTTGGVVVIEVQGNTTLAAGTSINASAKGFRGGSAMNITGWATSNSVGYMTNTSTNTGGHKGESIVGDTNIYKVQSTALGNLNYTSYYWNSTPLSICKGNVANGGGGGDANNCGGGGGSNGGVISQWNGMGNPDKTTANNIAAWSKETSATNTNGTLPPTSSSGGGRGGYAFSSSATADPTATGPDNTGVWAGDSRHNDGGWGGIPLDYSTGKIFFGGGGGAGDGNDGHASPGANGGGIIYLLSYGTVTGAGQIIADGGSPLPTSSFGSSTNGDDGAGGGGGGGTILIKSVGTISLTATTPISAQGGKGGNNDLEALVPNDHCMGPGGGGGGGYVATTNAVANTNVNAGANGNVTGNTTSKIRTKFPPNGATSGGMGGNLPTLTAPFYLTAKNDTVCPSSTASLSVTVNGTAPSGLAVEWYTASTGGTPVSTSTSYTFTSPATANTYTYYVGTCPGTYRIPVILVVNSSSAPTVTITTPSTTVCSGTNVILTASTSATSYTWSANAGSNINTYTASVNPTSNPTTYSVIVANTGACAGTGTNSININVLAAPTITITPTSYSICSGIKDTLTASGALSYTWSSNAASALTPSVSVLPTSTGIITYSVIGSNGTCSSTQTATINVTPTPTITISPTSAYICKGSSASFTASGATTSYSWSTSATTSTVSVTPTTNTTYTVTGNSGTCAATKTILVKVDNGITKADSTVNTTSCGQANGSYVLNSVTGGISPYQLNFNGLGFSTTYTVSNLAANPYPIIIKDSLGCTYTTSVSIGNTGGPTSVATSTITPDTCGKNVGTITVGAVSGGATPYQYSINGGVTYQSPAIFTGLAAGNYTVSIEDNNHCTITSTNNNVGVVNSAPSPTIIPVGNTTFCEGGSVTLTSSSAANNSWNNTGSTAQTITVTTSGVYTLTTTSSANCSATDTIRVTVNSIPATTVVNDTTVTECQNSIQTIHFNHSVGTVIIHNALGQVQTLPFKPTTSSTYTAYDSLNGCVSAVKNITIKINVAPITAPTVTTPVTYCYGQTTDTLQALPTVTGGYLIWEDVNHNVLTTPPTPSPSSTILGTTTYYVYQSTYYCPSNKYDSIQVIVLNAPSPNFTITPSTSILIGQTVSFAPIQTTTANTYYWNFDDATSSTNTSAIMLPTHTYNTAGSYCPKLTVTNSLGCKDSTTLCLDVLGNVSLIIPNVFSPNGDGINDFFSVKSTGITDLSCDIFDRWGLKLYTWDGISGYWDGTEKSGKAVDGTYFYVIQTTDIKGVSQTNRGFIELIR